MLGQKDVPGHWAHPPIPPQGGLPFSILQTENKRLVPLCMVSCTLQLQCDVKEGRGLKAQNQVMPGCSTMQGETERLDPAPEARPVSDAGCPETSLQSFLFPSCYYDPEGNQTNNKAFFLERERDYFLASSGSTLLVSLSTQLTSRWIRQLGATALLLTPGSFNNAASGGKGGGHVGVPLVVVLFSLGTAHAQHGSIPSRCPSVHVMGRAAASCSSLPVIYFVL